MWVVLWSYTTRGVMLRHLLLRVRTNQKIIRHVKVPETQSFKWCKRTTSTWSFLKFGTLLPGFLLESSTLFLLYPNPSPFPFLVLYVPSENMILLILSFITRNYRTPSHKKHLAYVFRSNASADVQLSKYLMSKTLENNVIPISKAFW